MAPARMNNLSLQAPRPRCRQLDGLAALLAVGSILSLCGGCDDPAALRATDVRVYSAPKATTTAAADASQPAATATATAASGPLALRYEPPTGWSDQGASGMRLATLAIGDPTAGHEVTIIPAAGSLEANVTRWLGQLDPSATPAALGERAVAALAAATVVEIDETQATVVLLGADAAVPDDTKNDAAGEAILAATIPLDEKTSLFVKFKGPQAIARREQDNFIRFVSSIRWK
jgi:hypothetical protein